MKCNNCGRINDTDSRFCTNCGSVLSNTDSQNETIITVGRSESNDIVIKNPNVSYQHAQFRISGDTIILEDLNSSNGTYINGEKAIISRVSSQDIIKFSSHYTFNWQELEKYLGKADDHGGKHQFQVLSSDIQSKSVITIGRTNENDIVLSNIKVSRKHARLIKSGNSWIIEDLESSNHTYVNGKKITRCIVNPKDTITIGGIPLTLGLLLYAKPEILENIKITAKNLSFVINDKTIIDDISLTIFPGEFVGLIGPSGAGKTSFMLMLNGVVRPNQGDVFINSESLFTNHDSFKGLIGYVPQDDIIHRELKVEESLKYTAKLRFNSKYSDTEIRNQVDTVIDTLDLSEARGTLIGNAEKKGISGGQRKRVNLGQELLTEPSILFLDEPTSGLDPKTDMDIMNVLKNISEKGKIVLLTTHNITVENFNTLTHLVVLTRGGKLAYFGPANEAVNYFEVSKPYEIFEMLSKREADHWKGKYRSSKYYKQFVKEREKSSTLPRTPKNTFEKEKRSTDLKQLGTLLERYFKIKLRDKVSTLILLLQAPIIAFLISLVFNKAEEKTQALFILVIAAIWLGCSNAAREIVSEQSIYKRERMVNLKIPSYLLSKILVLSILCLLQCSILSGITVPVLGLEVNFLRLLVLLMITSVSALSIGLFISSIVNTNEAAMGLVPIVLMPQVILGGLISKFSDMGGFTKFLSGLMISRWSFEASMIEEFGEKQNYLIQRIGFNENNFAIDYLMIIAFSLVFFLITGGLLKRKDSK